jgi:aspartyl-tRNA synthetase
MTEFTSIDLEISWIEDEDDVMSNQERMLQYAYQRVKDAHGDAIKEVFGLDIEVPQVPFPRVTMAEAHQILKEVGYQLPPEKKNDLDPGAERTLGDYIKQKTGSDFVYITEWPFAVRPFYHMKKGDNLTRSFDLLANGLEITTGAQREHRYDILLEQAKEKGLTADPIQFYLDFFRYGCPPHGGYGMGLSRLLMVMMKLSNIRETVYLFRGPNRLQP